MALLWDWVFLWVCIKMKLFSILNILIFFCEVNILCAQSFTSLFESKMVNENFIIEHHEIAERRYFERIYLVQFDTTIPRLELHFSAQRDLDYFNNYLYCFLSECHRDNQPLLLPGFPKLIYYDEFRGYGFENAKSKLFSRRNFVKFVRVVRQAEKRKKFRSVHSGWQRLNVRF